MTHDEYAWQVDGEDRSGDSSAVLLDPRELLQITVAELVEVFTAAVDHWGDPDVAEALIYDGMDGYLDPENIVIRSTTLVLRDAELCAKIEVLLEWPASTSPDRAEDFDGRLNEVRNVVDPYLRHRGSSLLELSQDAYGPWQSRADGMFVATIVAAQPADVTTLGDLAELGAGVERLVEALVGGTASRDTLADLIRGGHASLLVGLPEGNWLDVKSQEWDLKSDGDKYKLTSKSPHSVTPKTAASSSSAPPPPQPPSRAAGRSSTPSTGSTRCARSHERTRRSSTTGSSRSRSDSASTSSQ